jgi:hypothetical protein
MDKSNHVHMDTIEKQRERKLCPQLWQDARYQSVEVKKLQNLSNCKIQSKIPNKAPKIIKQFTFLLHRNRTHMFKFEMKHHPTNHFSH